MNLAFLVGPTSPLRSRVANMPPLTRERPHLQLELAGPAGGGKGAAAEEAAPWYLREIKYCQKCGGPMDIRTPAGEERERSVCRRCSTVFYVNPKIVCGAVPLSRDRKRVLLCKRAIPPVGRWTVPAGFMEFGESVAEGAAREAWEESRSRLKMGALLAVYSIVAISQVQLLHRAELLNEDAVAPGDETQEVRLFEWEHIPWDDLAFPTVSWALKHAYETRDKEQFLPQLRTKNADGTYS